MAKDMTTAQIDEQIALLKEQRKLAVAREKQADQLGCQLAKEKIGEMVLSLYEDGWRTVDVDSLARFVASARGSLEVVAKEDISEATAKWKKLDPVGIIGNAGKAMRPADRDSQADPLE